MARVYLDHNATTPLRVEARAAMAAAMDVVGNPSSVHAEGRAAKALLERARGQLAEALGAQAADIVFVSGATEAAALALAGRGLSGSGIEHDAVRSWIAEDLVVDRIGRVAVTDPARATLQLANSETGIVQDLPEGLAVSDWTQGFGKLPVAFDWSGVGMAFVSAHKIGGPKGIGALILRRGLDPAAQMRGEYERITRELEALKGQLAMYHEMVINAAKGSPKRAKVLQAYRQMVTNFIAGSNMLGVFSGAIGENFGYMARLDAGIKAAGGRKSEEAILNG
jgi:cysteine desulfurase